MLYKGQVDIILNKMSHNQTMKQKHGTCSQANTQFKTSFIIKRHNGNLFKNPKSFPNSKNRLQKN